MENKFTQYWRKANQWFYRTADRALDEAYKAALKIKSIEDEHFGGDKIAVASERTSNQVATYFQNDLNKYLNIARIRLAEFQTSRTVTGNNYPQSPDAQQFETGTSGFTGRSFNDINPYTQDIEYEARILEKLSFIDDILTRYADDLWTNSNNGAEGLNNSNGQKATFDRRANNLIAPNQRYSSTFDLTQPDKFTNNPDTSIADAPAPSNNRRQSNRMPNRPDRSDENISKKAIIDPSLIKTFRRIQQDLNPKAETQVIENYRFHQGKTRTALRFILMLILVPLLVQYISKIVVVGPVVDFYRSYRNADVFLNVNLEREAIEEMERFEKTLKFKQIVGVAPKLTSAQIERQIETKAGEIKVNYYRQSANAVKNWFADFLAILAFGWLISHSQQQINILKSFIDDLISGLSDTAKAFMIILLTDTFVGFHSPHGWEIILEGTAKHLGIPENREFNSLFIATFPVLIDTVFKYWIFRYLTGQSPSAVATFKTMNE
jgi:CemA family